MKAPSPEVALFWRRFGSAFAGHAALPYPWWTAPAPHTWCAEAYQSACLAGLGLIQAPRCGLGDALSQGHLVEVLPDVRRLLLIY